MGKIQHKDAINTFIKIGLFSGSLLITALAVYFYSPTFSLHADTSASENVDVRLNVRPTIALTTDVSELDLDARLNEFVSGPVNVDVVTNSQYGYTLTLEDADNNTSMVSSESSDVVTSDFIGSKTSSTMEGNTWGYSLDVTNFYKIPANGSSAVIGNTHVPSPSDPGYNRTVVNFGAKVGTALTAGSYEDTVLFTAYVNGQDFTPLQDTIHSISTMQEMTPAVCSATTTPTTSVTTFDWDGSHHGDNSYVPRTSLQDTRDGKYYLVSKLADGNCWMSQNLELELTAGQPVIASKVDGTTTTVTPDYTTQTTDGVSWDEYSDATTWRSIKFPSSQAYRQGGNIPSSSPTGSGREYDWEKAGIIYNLHAATAGISYNNEDGDYEADYSICPKGWRLPSEEGSKSLYNLFVTSYGAELGVELLGNEFFAVPLNFVQSGMYYGGRGLLDDSGGHYLTSTLNRYTNVEDEIEYYHNSVIELYIDFYESKTFYEFGRLSSAEGLSMRCVAI